jgi:hypothetical protein
VPKKQLVVKNENIPNTNDNLSEEKSKKIISHYETVIVKLREELSQQRQLLQKYRCKTRSQENTIVSLRKKSQGYKTRKQLVMISLKLKLKTKVCSVIL